MSRIGAKAKQQQTVKLSPERKRKLRAIVLGYLERQEAMINAGVPTPTEVRAGHMAHALIMALLCAMAFAMFSTLAGVRGCL